jgi:hypothetical protein
MNITANLIARIEDRYTETKTPCKSYKTEASAIKVAEKIAQEVANYFQADRSNTARPMRYVVVMVPAMNRYCIGFDMTELINRSSSTGGYLGVCGDHFTY